MVGNKYLYFFKKGRLIDLQLGVLILQCCLCRSCRCRWVNRKGVKRQNMEKDKFIKINLFSELTLEVQGMKYNLEEHLTKQLMDVLIVLILNYGRPISIERLIDLFWKDSESPLNSLKFSIFRLRKIFRNNMHGLENVELIKTSNKAYKFEPDIKCFVDAIEFQNYYLKIESSGILTVESLKYAEEMEKIYTGTLTVDTGNVWFLLITENFKELYLKAVKRLCDYYMANGYYDKLKSVSMKAVTLDPMVEENHFYYIQSLINMKESNKAFEYYQKSTKMLIDEYAMSLSDKMKDLYNYLVDGLENTENSTAITSYFKKKDFEPGALYCNHTIFDYIYDVHLRNAKRSKQRYYLYVFEVKTISDFEKLVPKIKICFQKSLRSGDVFTRVNRYQFLVLLTCKDNEEAHMIARRVSSNFRKKIAKRSATLYYHVENVIN